MAEVASVREILHKNRIYLESDVKKKKIYNEAKKAKLIQTEQLVKNTGMPRLMTQWRLFSNFVHAEYIGDRQYNQFYKEKIGLQESLSTTIVINHRITSELIFQFCRKYDFAQKWFDNLPLEKRVQMEHWRIVSSGMEQ